MQSDEANPDKAKAKIEIRHRYSGDLIFATEFGTIREAVGAALAAFANLREADLQNADLRGAMLQGSDLRGANLRGSDLQGSDLRNAKINWNSHSLISAILLAAADQHVGHRKIAGLVLVSPDWCWKKWLSLKASRHSDWVLDTLAPFVTENDNAPAILVEHAARLAERQSAVTNRDKGTDTQAQQTSTTNEH